MQLNFLLVLTIYITFILGITIIFEFIKKEPYTDITNYPLKDRLASYEEKKDYLETLNADTSDENYEKEVLKKAREQVTKLGDYNIVREQTNFANLDERFNNFQVGTKSVDFFSENPYDNMYYLNK